MKNRKKENRIREIQVKLKKKQEEEIKLKDEALGRKLEKAAQNYSKEV